MKIPSQARSFGVQFNLTPMIDVVFLLIIFFLVSSYLASTENQETIQLAPAAGGRYDSVEGARRIIVTVDADGRFLINRQEVTLAEFIRQIQPTAMSPAARDLEVRLRIDKRVPYQTVEPLLVACAKAGISRIQFNVVPASAP